MKAARKVSECQGRGGGSSGVVTGRDTKTMPRAELADLVQQLSDQMLAAARDLQFELAARLRDEVADLKKELRGMDAARRYRTDHALAGLHVPLVVVRGEHDRIAPLDWCRTLTADVTTVAGAGHMVPLTHPQAVADAVRRVGLVGQDAPRSS